MQEFISQYPWIIYAIILGHFLEGNRALKAAKNNQKVWFIIIFLLNTLAILDIIYIMFVGKEKRREKGSEKWADNT